MKECNTKYGVLKGVIQESYYPNGNLKDCQLEEYNEIKTEVGTFVPKYELFDTRTKHRNALEFFESGAIKSVYLERQTEVKSAVGPLKAELITFYEEGAVHRIFPLYGQISGYWSEEEEFALAESTDIHVGSMQFEAKISCFCFYPSGALRSLTLWEEETVKVETPLGSMKMRLGISFYENGNLKSIEPYHPFKIQTPIGISYAYDNQPIGIHGDTNSLCFKEDGSIQSFITSISGVKIEGENGTVTFAPALVPSRIDLEATEIEPIKVAFQDNALLVTDAFQNEHIYSMNQYKCSTFTQNLDEKSGGCSGKCGGCQKCGLK